MVIVTNVYRGGAIHEFVHVPQTTTNNEGIFIQDFLVILLAKASELLENLEVMFPRFYILSMF